MEIKSRSVKGVNNISQNFGKIEFCKRKYERKFNIVVFNNFWED